MELRWQVPLSEVGFVSGELYHTNEVLCPLGAGYFAWRTVPQAHQIIDRRLGMVDAELRRRETEASQQDYAVGLGRAQRAKEVQSALESAVQQGAQTRAADGIVDIREHYATEEEALAAYRVPQSSSSTAASSSSPLTRADEAIRQRDDSALFARMDELAAMEEAWEREHGDVPDHENGDGPLGAETGRIFPPHSRVGGDGDATAAPAAGGGGREAGAGGGGGTRPVRTVEGSAEGAAFTGLVQERPVVAEQGNAEGEGGGRGGGRKSRFWQEIMKRKENQ